MTKCDIKLQRKSLPSGQIGRYKDFKNLYKMETNVGEGSHRQVRKVTKIKDPFTSAMALQKLVYLATKNIEKKWTSPLQNHNLTVQQIAVKFGDWLSLDLDRKAND